MDALKNAQRDGIVLGLKALSDPKPRLDIDEALLNQPDAFNLFLLAIAELQRAEHDKDLMGYFQITGILSLL